MLLDDCLLSCVIAEILKVLNDEIVTCRQTVWRLQQHIEVYGTIEPLPKSGRLMKLSATALQSIVNTMQRDNETTAKELVATLRVLCVYWAGHDVEELFAILSVHPTASRGI